MPEEQYNILIQEITPSDKVLETLDFYYPTDNCEMPSNPIQLGLEQALDEARKYIGRGYYGNNYSMYQILQECQSMLENYPLDSIEASRIKELINTRDLSSFKALYLSSNDANPKLLDNIFEILSSDDMLSKFLDYSNNIETFSIDGQDMSRSEYLKHLGNIFGNKDAYGNLKDTKLYI